MVDVYSDQEFDYGINLSRLLRNYKHDVKACCLIQKAFMYAMEAHYDIKRKSGEPYVTHPIAVALELEKKRADYETICAALLHDTIEDCKWIDKEKIEKEFGAGIATKVFGVTKVSMKNAENKDLQIMLTQNKVVASIFEDIGIPEIKIHDRKHNMETIEGHKDLNKRKQIAKETMEVYVPIARHFGQFDDKEFLERKCFQVLHPQIDKKIKKMKNDEIDSNAELSKLIFDLQYDGSSRSIKKNLIEQGINVDDVEFKFKEVPAIYRQLQKGKEFSKIPDLMTFIIKTKTVDDVYKALQVINEKSKPLNDGEYQMKDYISHPKYAYFKALHTFNIVQANGKNYLFHFQIQTTEMWRESVNGIASKWNYDVDNTGANKMKESLAHDFPFYDDLKRLYDDYKIGVISEIEFNKRVKHLILPRVIYINMGGFTYEETFDGCTIKDFILRLSKKGKIPKIIPNQAYYVNGSKKELNYVLHDGDLFEIRTNTFENSSDLKEKSITRKREK